MNKSSAGLRLWLIGLMLVFLLSACKKTRDFTYKHPKNPSRLLHVVLSLDSADLFRVTIDGELVAEKKIDLKPKGTKGFDSTGGFFETEYVNVFCIRDYVSIKATSCDFIIGSGPPVNLFFD